MQDIIVVGIVKRYGNECPFYGVPRNTLHKEKCRGGVSQEARELRARAILFASVSFSSVVIFLSNPPRVVLPSLRRVRRIYRIHITYFSAVVFRKENRRIILRMERNSLVFTNS
jgi:hypothetical protein